MTYFSKESNLPDPSGLLARSITKSSILAANSKVRELLNESNQSTSSTKTRGPYAKFNQNQKANVEKYAAENGVTAAVWQYIKEFPALKENTVRDWRDTYRLEISKKRSSSGDADVHELPAKKKCRPLLLGEELDRQVQAYLTNF